MPRKKVKLEYITDDTKRNITFRKREQGLIKKVDEITTLCGIDACAIIFNPNYPQPNIWPSEVGVQNVLSRFRAMPEVKQTKKMLDQEGILKQQILKAQEQLQKQRDDNKKQEMNCLMLQSIQNGQIVDDMSINDLNSLSLLIDENLRRVEQRLDGMPTQEQVQNVGAQFVSTEGDQQNMAHAQELVIGGGEQEIMGHAQEPEINMNVFESDQLWSMDFANDNGDIDDVLSFGYVAALNGVGPNP